MADCVLHHPGWKSKKKKGGLLLQRVTKQGLGRGRVVATSFEAARVF